MVTLKQNFPQQLNAHAPVGGNLKNATSKGLTSNRILN